MQGTSDAFQTAVRGSHQAVCRVDIIRDDKVVATLPVFDGQVTADRTAAQMRAFTASVADPTGVVIPLDKSALLAPFGTRAALYRGVRVPSADTSVTLANDVASWSTGTNNGVVPDTSTGELRLGWNYG